MDTMLDSPLIAPGMAPVAEAFARMIADGRELGGEVAVYRDGEPLLIARGGTADRAGRPWEAGTLVQVFATGKAIAAAAALAAVADGARIDVAMPVYRPVPEAGGAPTGADSATVLQAWLPPVYLHDAVAGTATRRRGASGPRLAAGGRRAGRPWPTRPGRSRRRRSRWR